MKKKRLPVSLRSIAGVIRAIQNERSDAFTIAMVGETGVGKKALASLISFESKETAGRVDVIDVKGVIDPEQFALMKKTELVLIAVDGSKGFPGWLKPIINDLRKIRKEYLLIINKADVVMEGYSGLEAKALRELEVEKRDVVAISLLKGERIKESLMPAIVSRARHFRLALGTSFPIFKEEVAKEIIIATSKQNGVVGFIFFLPGADFSVLSLNQLRMVLSLAVLYGEELNLERAIEIIIMFGGGVTFRAIARELLDLLPAVGWFIKGAVAYSGTLTLGKAAQKYFESGARVTPASVVTLARKLVDRGFGSQSIESHSSQG